MRFFFCLLMGVWGDISCLLRFPRFFFILFFQYSRLLFQGDICMKPCFCTCGSLWYLWEAPTAAKLNRLDFPSPAKLKGQIRSQAERIFDTSSFLTTPGTRSSLCQLSFFSSSPFFFFFDSMVPVGLCGICGKPLRQPSWTDLTSRPQPS